jgi:hypothetical protein
MLEIDCIIVGSIPAYRTHAHITGLQHQQKSHIVREAAMAPHFIHSIGRGDCMMGLASLVHQQPEAFGCMRQGFARPHGDEAE